MSPEKQSELKEFIEDHLNIEAYFLDDLAEWVKIAQAPTAKAKIEAFKNELRNALDKPGTVTCDLYKKWTGENLDNQTGVQQRLQEIWHACFE